MQYQAERAFASAATRLNSKNLTHLWAVSSVLSGLDYIPRVFGDSGSLPMFPLLHPMKTVAFNWAILKCTSLDYRDRYLTRRDLIHVMNNLNQASLDPNFLKPIGEESDTSRLLRHFSTMANKQFRFQTRDFLLRFGRSYLLTEAIPVRVRELLRERLGPSFLDIPTEFSRVAGLSPSENLALGLGILALLRARFQDLIQAALESVGSANLPGRDKRQADFLYTLLPHPDRLKTMSIFRASELVLKEGATFTPTKVDSFLSLVARTTQFLRSLSTKPPYDKGFLSYRLSPLERYPLIAPPPGNGSWFIAPSLHYLDRIITELPHYLLQDTTETRSKYQTTRGVVQEIYLSQLLEYRLPSLRLIAERTYKRSGGSWKGPDLTILDPRAKRLILLESKAVRIQARAISDTALQPLLHDLDDAVGAARRLYEKWQHFKQRLPEYKDWQAELDAHMSSPPIAVIVIGEGVEFLAEKIELAVQAGLVDSLGDLPFPYCFMDLETFEYAVEVAVASREGLAQILEEYSIAARAASDGQGNAEAADRFGGRPIPPTNPFLSKATSTALTRLGLPDPSSR